MCFFKKKGGRKVKCFFGLFEMTWEDWKKREVKRKQEEEQGKSERGGPVVGILNELGWLKRWKLMVNELLTDGKKLLLLLVERWPIYFCYHWQSIMRSGSFVGIVWWIGGTTTSDAAWFLRRARSKAAAATAAASRLIGIHANIGIPGSHKQTKWVAQWNADREMIQEAEQKGRGWNKILEESQREREREREKEKKGEDSSQASWPGHVNEQRVWPEPSILPAVQFIHTHTHTHIHIHIHICTQNEKRREEWYGV